MYVSRRLLLALALMTTSGCTAYAGVDSQSQAIVRGDLHDGDPAVPLLDLGALGGYCTGTLISPSIVLTAAHCLDDPESMMVRFVNRAGQDGPAYSVVGHAVPEPSDIGLIALSEPVEDVEPRPFNVNPLDDNIGAPVRLVGFGATAETRSDFGVKRIGRTTLERVKRLGRQIREDEMATSNERQGTCYGDSGGPNFMDIDGVEHVVAVTSRGTDECGAGLDVAVRTDAHASFILKFFEDHDPDNCALANDCDTSGLPASAGGGGGCQASSGSPGVVAALLLALIAGAGLRRTARARAKRPTKRGTSMTPTRLFSIFAVAVLGLSACAEGSIGDPADPPPEVERNSPDGNAPEQAQPGPEATPSPAEAAQTEPYVLDEEGYIHLNDEANARAREVLRILQKDPLDISDEENAIVDAWKAEVARVVVDTVDQELRTGERREAYETATEARRAAMRESYLRTDTSMDVLIEKAGTVKIELYSNRMAQNLRFEAELLFNAMYMALRKKDSVREGEFNPSQPRDAVDDAIRRCGRRLRIDLSHYR